MSDWIANHENNAAEMNSAITTNTNAISNLTNEVNKKVDKVEGKSLISDTEITRLAGIDGTVTSVGISVPTGLKVKDGTSPITTSGTIEVELDEGYVIPKSADIVPSTRKVNEKVLSADIVLNGADIKADGYTKSTSASAIEATDTINQAFGKLEYKADTNTENIEKNKTNISTLKKHVTGDLTDSDFQEDSTVAMTKTVPTGMSNYAAIKVIGGKTVKTKNLLKPQNGLKEATVNGVTFTPVFDSNGYLEYVIANGTATANASFIVTKLKEDISGYILSLGLSQESVSYGIACELGVSPWTTYQTIKGSGEKTVPSITYTDTINVYIQVLKDAVANNVKFYPMLRKSGTSSVYEPYHGDLWNAPIESVSSVYSKNLFPKKAVNLSYNSEMAARLHIPAGNYVFSAIGSSTITINIIFKYIDGTSKMVSLGIESEKRTAVAVTLTDTVISMSSYVNGNIKIDNVQLEKGKAMTEYEPYHEATILVPDLIRILPDYGVGIDPEHCNWIDFENMVYHHDYTLYDLTGKGWTSDGNGVFHTSYPTNAKVKAYGICNNYMVDYSSNTPHDVGDMIVRDPAYNVMYVKVESGTSPDTTGTLLYYELADDKKELIDISDILYPIRCEAGGIIMLNNEHSLDVPNTIIYKKEVPTT